MRGVTKRVGPTIIKTTMKTLRDLVFLCLYLERVEKRGKSKLENEGLLWAEIVVMVGLSILDNY